MAMNNGKIDGVLVAFSYGVISGSKRDPTITAEVLEDHNSSQDAGAWSNRLFPASTCGKVNAYTALRKHLSQMRGFHYSNSYVMEDAIWRILPNKRVAAYKQIVEQDGKARALELLDTLINDLPNLIDLARLGRGQAFKESDYPSAQDIRDTFKYSVSYRPIPSTSDLNPAIFQDAINELNTLHQQRLQEANAALLERFIEPFKTLQEQMADPKGRKLAPVLESIREITDMIPSLDLSGNQELLATAQQMHELFAKVEVEELKKDQEMQQLLATTATNVIGSLTKMGQVGARKFS